MMSLYKFRWLIILCIYFLYSCGTTDDKIQSSYSLTYQSTLNIQDTLLSNVSLCLREVQDSNKKYLLFQRHSELHFYDITTSSIAYTVRIPSNSYWKANSYTAIFVNFDSIYIVPFMNLEMKPILLIDRNGNLKDTIVNTSNSQIENKVSCVFCNGIFPHVYDNHIILPNRSTLLSSKFDYYDKSHAFQFFINLENRTYELLADEYPPLYKGKLWNREYFHEISPKGQLIMSFASSPELFIKDVITGSNRKVVFAGSKYIDNVKPLSSWDDWQAKKKYYVSEAYYQYIVYDKYRDVYLRFAFLPTDFINVETGNEREEYDKPFSIIILDKNFRILGETKFGGDKYVNGVFFISEAGLNLLDKRTFLGESSQNGNYTFDIFSIQENK